VSSLTHSCRKNECHALGLPAEGYYSWEALAQFKREAEGKKKSPKWERRRSLWERVRGKEDFQTKKSITASHRREPGGGLLCSKFQGGGMKRKNKLLNPQVGCWKEDMGKGGSMARVSTNRKLGKRQLRLNPGKDQKKTILFEKKRLGGAGACEREKRTPRG